MVDHFAVFVILTFSLFSVSLQSGGETVFFTPNDSTDSGLYYFNVTNPERSELIINSPDTAQSVAFHAESGTLIWSSGRALYGCELKSMKCSSPRFIYGAARSIHSFGLHEGSIYLLANYEVFSLNVDGSNVQKLFSLPSNELGASAIGVMGGRSPSLVACCDENAAMFQYDIASKSNVTLFMEQYADVIAVTDLGTCYWDSNGMQNPVRAGSIFAAPGYHYINQRALSFGMSGVAFSKLNQSVYIASSGIVYACQDTYCERFSKLYTSTPAAFRMATAVL